MKTVATSTAHQWSPTVSQVYAKHGDLPLVHIEPTVSASQYAGYICGDRILLVIATELG